MGLSPAIHSPRRGLSRSEAAAYVGISPSFFDALVKSGRMPKAISIGGRRVWDIRQLDEAFEDFAGNQSNSWDKLVNAGGGSD